MPLLKKTMFFYEIKIVGEQDVGMKRQVAGVLPGVAR